jgi:hypothetical protein
MRVSGELSDPGATLIVDVGASKMAISLMHNSESGLREIRTVGDSSSGTEVVRDGLVDSILPAIQEKVEVVEGKVRVALGRSVSAAIEKPDSPRIVVEDLGNGDRFETDLKPGDVENAASPVVARVTELCAAVWVTEAEYKAIKIVRCVGGGTKLGPVRAAIQKAFPDAEIRQLDPDSMDVCGATLDAAQATGRLPESLQTPVRAVVPYSIGNMLVGEVIGFLIQRGELLPAVGETSLVTVKDGQTSMDLSIYQGEHYLAELSNKIGTARIDGLPAMARGQCDVSVRIEYDENGILQFSAEEKRRQLSIQAVFAAQTEFTDEDHARLQTTSQAEEMKTANLRHVRKKIVMDLDRADKMNAGPTFGALIAKWRQWMEAHTTEGSVDEFVEAQYSIRREFRQLDAKRWEEPQARRLDQRFTPIWPPSAGYTDDGTMIFRFLASRDLPEVTAKTTNMATGDVSKSFDVCQFEAGDRLETIVKVYFPENGKYRVMLFIGAVATHLSPVRELMYEDKAWRFTVEGAPAPKRRLAQIIEGREFRPVSASADQIRITPGASCVKLPGREYKFTCAIKGTKLVVNGREMDGEEKTTLFPKQTQKGTEDGFAVYDGSLTFPSDGMWRVIFFVGGKVGAVQFVVTGEATLRPTAAETIALESRTLEFE